MPLERAARALAIRSEGEHVVQVGLDQTKQCDHNRRVKRLIEPRGTEEVPRVNHEIEFRKRRNAAAGMPPLG